MPSSPSNPLVTFLVPCFNYAQYLRECIGSIQKQSFLDYEILILDDASTDETSELAQQLLLEDRRIRYHRHETNVGHLNNYNFGLTQARGELIWLLSADDCLDSDDVLKDFVTQFILNPKLGYAFCRVQCINSQSEPYEKYIPNQQNSELPYHSTLFSGHLLFSQLVKGNFVPAPSTLARKACYEQYGFFHPALSHSGDWYNWLLFALDWDVFFEPKPKVYYRKHPLNMHQTYKEPRHALENSLHCLQELDRYLQDKKYPSYLKKQLRWAILQFKEKNNFEIKWQEKLIGYWTKLTSQYA